MSYGVLDQPANERFYEPGIMARAQSLLLIPDIGFGIDVFGILSKTHRTVGVAFSLAFHNNKYRHGD